VHIRDKNSWDMYHVYMHTYAYNDIISKYTVTNKIEGLCN